MDVHNVREALKEVEEDILEGADIVMVKPAMSFFGYSDKSQGDYECSGSRIFCKR